MFERPKSGEHAILVHIEFRKFAEEQSDFNEFYELAIAAGAIPVASVQSVRDRPSPKFFIGKGKVQEIAQLVPLHKVEIILINHDLTPAQERNLEKELKCRVLSRTGLILDIFARRARTFEGKLQVELAQLEHLSTRLVRGWTHLERQKGGIGLRGPGETQLETDRRLVRNRIKVIHERLEQVRKQRQQNRSARQRMAVPTVAIVGYTNAGKSTLFNALTGANVWVANQLFATLDPTLRSITLPGIGSVVLADTVGFVQKLPHSLVDAFHATLEETTLATLLLHVVDAHSPFSAENREEVNKVLQEIGADEIPQIVVLNKVDLIEEAKARTGQIEHNEKGEATRIWVSALNSGGLEELKLAIRDRLSHDIVLGILKLGPHQAEVRAALFELQAVDSERVNNDGEWEISIRLPRLHWQKLCRTYEAYQLQLE